MGGPTEQIPRELRTEELQLELAEERAELPRFLGDADMAWHEGQTGAEAICAESASGTRLAGSSSRLIALFSFCLNCARDPLSNCWRSSSR